MLLMNCKPCQNIISDGTRHYKLSFVLNLRPMLLFSVYFKLSLSRRYELISLTDYKL